MNLCDVCQNIDLRDLLQSYHSSPKFPADYTTKHKWYEYKKVRITGFQAHHASITALKLAVDDGCELCRMIWAHHCHFWSQNIFPSGEDTIKAHEMNCCACKQCRGPLLSFIDQGDRHLQLVVAAMLDNNGQGESNICEDVVEVAKFKICTVKGAEIPERDAHLLEYIVRDETPSDLRSEMCLSLAAKWLDICCREHAECCSYKDRQAFFPTRVIEVGDLLTQPHLHISGEGETERYVALSYCWGGNSNFTLNAATVDCLRSGWSLAELPSTLRDAVLVTRALGVRYLWVDSLCIFQDDVDDWAIEASKMSRVYRHAAVTIVAASAETVDDGFLDKRAPYFSCPFPWRRHDHPNNVVDGSRAYPVILQSTRSLARHRDRPSDSRWATRGWTFQEELLSERLLCYTKEEMIWQCRTGTALEPAEKASPWFTMFLMLKTCLADSNELREFPARLYDAWYFLMRSYAERNLTFDDDRLPAIGAIAEAFHTKLKEQYCAGLWRGDLLYGLLWSTRLDTKRPLPAGASSNGPSWSWVGADTYADLKWFTLRDTLSLTYLARVVDVTVRGKLHDDFGRIAGAELILEAPYWHLQLRPGSYPKPRWNPAGWVQRVLTRLSPMESTRSLVQLALMNPEQLEPTQTSSSVRVPSSSTKFTLIQIAKGLHKGSTKMRQLLILQPQTEAGNNLRGPQRYRRVGLLWLQPFEAANYDSSRSEMTARLEGAAYREVVRQRWPVETFIID